MQYPFLAHDEAFQFYRTYLQWYASQTHPRYLEIGCANAEFMRLGMYPYCPHLTGIDVVHSNDWDLYKDKYPNLFCIKITSDDFFRQSSTIYDLIFIDGDHSYEQVTKDIEHSLNHLSKFGLIVIHDLYPPDPTYLAKEYCDDGSLWLEVNYPYRGLQVFTFPVTYGLTLIQRQLSQIRSYDL